MTISKRVRKVRVGNQGHLTRAEAQALVERWAEGSLTLPEFAAAEGVSPKRLRNWCRQAGYHVVRSRPERVQFVEAFVVDGATPSQKRPSSSSRLDRGVRVSTGAVVVTLDDGVTAHDLSVVLRAVQGLSRCG